MAKRIIILEHLRSDVNTVQYVLWAVVPPTRKLFYADPNAVSAYRDTTPSEIIAIQDGSVTEKIFSIQVKEGTTKPQLKSLLESLWSKYQDEISTINPWKNYGTSWDGTVWSNEGVN